MIGGIDVRIPSGANSHSVEAAVRAVRQAWPQAVFENGNTGERYGRFWEIPFGQIDEIFVYRDTACADLWDRFGAVPEATNKMIHIIHDEGLITAVIDEKSAEMDAAMEAIRSALSDNIFFTPALLEAA
jgi:hypothetical protein